MVVVTPRSDVSWRAHDATEGRCDRAGRVVGVIVIVRPVTGVANPGQLIALAAAVGFGISIAMVKSLTGTELTLANIFGCWWCNRLPASYAEGTSILRDVILR